ncbi:MAG: hypothetical protein AB7H90_01325 [Alphaproteobacteria bacterium]
MMEAWFILFFLAQQPDAAIGNASDVWSAQRSYPSQEACLRDLPEMIGQKIAAQTRRVPEISKYTMGAVCVQGIAFKREAP